MDCRTYIILFIISKFGSERSVSGIFHLLTGKKSAQTIQDGRFFDVLYLFSTLDHLTREDIQNTISYLEKCSYINRVYDEHYDLTFKGRETITNYLLTEPFPKYLDGWKYHHSAKIFWARYSFMVQCLSNLIHGNNKFLPITRDLDVQRWVKNNLSKKMESRKSYAIKIYTETEFFLRQLDEQDALYFTLRLTSFHKVGLTHEQCATILKLDCDAAKIRFQSVLHQLLHEIDQVNEKYTSLSLFIHDIKEQFPLTISTKKTYMLLNQGKSLHEISKIRRLKLNTIEDHLVEIAINIPNFNIDRFVNQMKQQIITKKIKQLNTKRLKVIKDQLDEDISYFDIRLVMARL